MDTTNHGSKIPTKPTEGKIRKMSEKHINIRGIKIEGKVKKTTQLRACNFFRTLLNIALITQYTLFVFLAVTFSLMSLTLSA